MKGMRVICARWNSQTKRIEVVREITNDDDSIEYNCLTMDREQLEWLSACYEIDDIDEVVEISIYDSLMPVDDVHPDAQAARLQKRARLQAAKTRLGNMTPINGRVILKQRLQDAGIPQEYVNAIDDGTAVEVIKRHSRLDPEELAKKREHIRAVRKGEPANMMPSPKPSQKSNDARTKLAKSVEVKLPKISLRGGKRVT